MNKPSNFIFDSIYGVELSLAIYCPNVQILLNDSIFENVNLIGPKILIVYNVLTNNSILS